MVSSLQGSLSSAKQLVSLVFDVRCTFMDLNYCSMCGVKPDSPNHIALYPCSNVYTVPGRYASRISHRLRVSCVVARGQRVCQRVDRTHLMRLERTVRLLVVWYSVCRIFMCIYVCGFMQWPMHVVNMPQY